MASIPIYKRGVPWPFTFKIKEADGSYRDLNGYTLYFAVKSKLDSAALDDLDTTVYKTSVVISTSGTSKQVIVPKADTDVAPGRYFVGARLVNGATEVPIDGVIEVVHTTNNRSS